MIENEIERLRRVRRRLEEIEESLRQEINLLEELVTQREEPAPAEQEQAPAPEQEQEQEQEE